MTTFRWTFVALVLIAGLVAFTYFDSQRGEKERVKKEESSLVFSLPQGDITHIDIVSHATRVIADRTGDDVWELLQPLQDRADAGVINTFLSTVGSEKVSDVVTDDADAEHLKSYGLDRPTFTLTLATKSGAQQVLKIGAVTAFDGSPYGQIEGEKKVILLTPAWDSHLAKPLLTFRDKHLIRTEMKSVARLHIQTFGKKPEKKPEKKASDVVLTRNGEKWSLADSADLPLDLQSIADYVDQIKSTRGTDFKPGWKPSGEPWMEIEMTSTEQKISTIKIYDGKPDAVVIGSDLKEPLGLYRASALLLSKVPTDFILKRPTASPSAAPVPSGSPTTSPTPEASHVRH